MFCLSPSMLPLTTPFSVETEQIVRRRWRFGGRIFLLWYAHALQHYLLTQRRFFQSISSFAATLGFHTCHEDLRGGDGVAAGGAWVSVMQTVVKRAILELPLTLHSVLGMIHLCTWVQVIW